LPEAVRAALEEGVVEGGGGCRRGRDKGHCRARLCLGSVKSSPSTGSCAISLPGLFVDEGAGLAWDGGRERELLN
jgi:hypothetical protein